jgi:hypothetical protein
VGTLLAAKLWQAAGWSAATSPTILAWYLEAFVLIRPIEVRGECVARVSKISNSIFPCWIIYSVMIGSRLGSSAVAD